MPSVNVCPKCKCLPYIRFRKRFVRTLCVISCPNIGCPHYIPIVTSGFSENNALNKAVEKWNQGTVV